VLVPICIDKTWAISLKKEWIYLPFDQALYEFILLLYTYENDGIYHSIHSENWKENRKRCIPTLLSNWQYKSTENQYAYRRLQQHYQATPPDTYGTPSIQEQDAHSFQMHVEYSSMYITFCAIKHIWTNKKLKPYKTEFLTTVELTEWYLEYPHILKLNKIKLIKSSWFKE
jgi:hypothetical protein